MKRLAIWVCSFMIGVGVGYYWNAARQDRLGSHWRAVEEFRQYFSDPSGWAGSTQPQSPEVSLAVLLQAGVLSHIDIVFPNVRYEQKGLVEFWGERCVSNTNIVFAFGNPSVYPFRASGVQPLHLNIWFMKEATEDVKRMINEIDDVWGNQPQGDQDASQTGKMSAVKSLLEDMK